MLRISGLLAQQTFQAGASAILARLDAKRFLLAALDSLLAQKPFRTCFETTSREQSVVLLIAERHTNRSIGAATKLRAKFIEPSRFSARSEFRRQLSRSVTPFTRIWSCLDEGRGCARRAFALRSVPGCKPSVNRLI